MAEEPVKPKGRSRKPEPAAASLFDWALSLEQEREKEPVGAGRKAATHRGRSSLRQRCLPCATMYVASFAFRPIARKSVRFLFRLMLFGLFESPPCLADSDAAS